MTTSPRFPTGSPREHLSPYQPRNGDQSVALRGASRAFVLAPVKPASPANAYSGTNGAMAAAAFVGTRSSSSANKLTSQPAENRESASTDDTSLSTVQQPFVRDQAVGVLAKSSSLNSLRIARDDCSNNSAPPSNIAATLAVARFTPQNTADALLRPGRSPDRANPRSMDAEDHSDTLPAAGSVRIAKQHFSQLDRDIRGGSTLAPGGAQIVNGDLPPDPTSSASAASLIDLFESNGSNVHLFVNGRPPKSISMAHAVQSPRPIQPSSRSPLTVAILAAQKSMPSKKEREASDPQESQQKANVPPVSPREASAVLETEPDDSSSIGTHISTLDIKMKPAVPPPRKKRTRQASAQRASPPPPHQPSRSPQVTAQGIVEPLEGEVQTRLTTQADLGMTISPHGPRVPSPGERWTATPGQRMTPYLTGESFANAIVASSLASSRAPSPSKSPAPPPLPKRHHHLLNQHHQSSRTPSPTGGMRQTMRKPPRSDDESQVVSVTHRKGRNLITKAPNKHHEGNRRRWRNEITDRERKRYEGVWAANKGLYTSTAAEESQPLESSAGRPCGEDVSNLVVRDIWSRSRLENAILEEIWDLVDRRGIGRLTREEFVIGMWLIDQRLKGRKLPAKISASIWDSVRKLGSARMPRRKS